MHIEIPIETIDTIAPNEIGTNIIITFKKLESASIPPVIYVDVRCVIMIELGELVIEY